MKITKKKLVSEFKQQILVVVVIVWLKFSRNSNSQPEVDLAKPSIVVTNSVRGGGNSRKLPSNFDMKLHRELEETFPDMPSRVEHKKVQPKFYRSAWLKLYTTPIQTVHDKYKMLWREEIDAIAYFQGEGFYRERQDLKTHSNIFDTRESFLFVMHLRID